MTARPALFALLLLSTAASAASAGPVPPSALSRISNALPAFGRAVAIAGEYAFVGEPSVGGGRGGGDAVAGLVHVYRRGATGWREVAKLESPSGRPGDGFGVSVVADGSTLLVGQVGAPQGGGGRGGDAAPAAPPTDPGTVHVFRRGADGKWTASGTLASSLPAGSEFGAAMAVSGDLAIVGAPGAGGTGAVHVYRRGTDGQWSAAGTVPAQSLAAGDRFGSAVAIDRDRIVVGAPNRAAKGAVYLYQRGQDGNWTADPASPLATARLADGAQFGAAVAVQGDRVVVGAPGASFAPPPPASAPTAGRGGGGGGRGGAPAAPGVVAIYDRNSGRVWIERANLTPFDMGTVRFGAAVAILGDEVWVGAPGSDNIGRIYRAKQEKGGSWSGMTKLSVVDDSLTSNAAFGTSFAVSGDAAIVGMPGDGGGAGTVAFLGKSATGSWVMRNTSFPPIPDAYSAVTGKEIRCADGKASAFDCSNTGLVSFLPLSALGARRGVRLSSMWGWTDPLTGRDIAIVGRQDGTAFVDITDPANPRYLGDMMRTPGATQSSWREIKTYKNHAFVVSDGSGDHHGVQIFDLTRLRTVKTPQRFLPDLTYPLGAIHNIIINETSGFAYAVGGGSGCRGSHIFDIRNPRKPSFVGCFADTATGRTGGGGTHDGQCVTYHGPDKRYTGHEVCLMANVTHISIQDMTDKSNPKVISHVTYPNVAYAHQGWFSEDQKYWFENDELDEGGFATAVGATGVAGVCPCGKAAEGSRTLIWDMTDLEDPVLAKEFIGTTHATDHNEFVKGNRLYQSNYRAGLRILDITDPLNPREAGYLDTFPTDNSKDGGGTWSNYPWFKNGTIGVVSGSEGLFIVRDRTTTTVP